VKPGVHHDRTGRPDDRPDKEIERLQDIVRIAVDEISGRAPRMMTIADRVNFMSVVRHGLSPFGVMAGLVPAIHALTLAQRSRLMTRNIRRSKKTPAQSPGFFTQTLPRTDADATNHTTKKRRRSLRLQLAVFAQHGAALVANAPAMGGKRRPAAQKIG